MNENENDGVQIEQEIYTGKCEVRTPDFGSRVVFSGAITPIPSLSMVLI
jgi:hypothetical protein